MPNAASRTTRPFAPAPRATLDIHLTVAAHSTRVIFATRIHAERTPIVNRVRIVKETTGPYASAAPDISVIPSLAAERDSVSITRTVPRTKPAMATNASIRARAPPPDRFAVLVLDATHVITELCALARLARMAILWLNVDRLLEAKFS